LFTRHATTAEMMISNSISKVTTMGGDIEMAFRQILKSVVR
jgi:hypothetical protein